MIVLGVISDTHIPDRARQLHPRVFEIFKSVSVEAILHAGDVSVPKVLDELGEIAPVYAVRGNRDWLKIRSLPVKRTLEYEGVQIGLIHGHGSLGNYIADKGHYIFWGLQEVRYVLRAVEALPDARVIVFGHTHLKLEVWMNGKLLFNPGSACCPHEEEITPSVGLLRLNHGEVEPEIIDLW